MSTAAIRMRVGLACLLAFAAVFGAVNTQAAATLTISFAESRPSTGRVYTSDAADPVRELRVLAGSTVSLQTEQGRAYETSGGGWGWTEVEQVPAQASAVSITPQLEGDTVTLEVKVYNRDGDSSGSYNTTISGPVGEWLQLLGPEQRQRSSGKVYSAGGGSKTSYSRGLYVKVDLPGSDLK